MDKFWLFSSPVYVVVIISAYMSFVLHFGPRWMKNREPFNLKYVIIVYNLLQVYYNFWMTREVIFIFLWLFDKNIRTYANLDLSNPWRF